MFDLKPLTIDGIPAALEKAMRYRLLNEPAEAESICLDVLRADPDNQQALVSLLLALTDQFGTDYASNGKRAQEVLERIVDPYEHTYYAGIISERKAKGHLAHPSRAAHFETYDLVREAMNLYEKADAIRPAGNDDARLRWNTCARLIERHKLRPRPGDDREPPLE
jgi:hypothetical protein